MNPVKARLFDKNNSKRVTNHFMSSFVLKQWFKNNPANGEFRRAETLKCLRFAVFKNLFAGLDFTKRYTFYSGVTITAEWFYNCL